MVINQGSLVIEADQVTVYYKDNKVSRIVCLGLPASYQQQAAEDGGLIIATAEPLFICWPNMKSILNPMPYFLAMAR